MELVNLYVIREEVVSVLQYCVMRGFMDVIDFILKIYFKILKFFDVFSECVEFLMCVVKLGLLDVLQRLLGYVDLEFLEMVYFY